jgi:hypothetical protein
MTTAPTPPSDLASLQALDTSELIKLNWQSLNCFTGELLELHAEGKLGNENFAKLPRKPILCIDQIDLLDEQRIEATFQFPANHSDWPFAVDESLEMLFQDQLDQLVGFWGARKIEGIGRALSSGRCTQHHSLDFKPSMVLKFVLEKRKWMASKDGGGTAVFNGQILNESGDVLLDTRNVIVGILNPDEIRKLRQQYGGTTGVAAPDASDKPHDLMIPVYDNDLGSVRNEDDGSLNREATQAINPELWPLRYHFRGDPVVPGNFGTHGMIALLKASASEDFGLKNPVFKSMQKKSFSGMIFEDTKQIRFSLSGITQNDDGDVCASEGNLYLENTDGSKMIDTPIYAFKGLTVAER